MSVQPTASLPMNLRRVGRVTPCAPRKTCFMVMPGAHGVTRPTFRFMSAMRESLFRRNLSPSVRKRGTL